MQIKELFNKKNPVISFEVFPPNKNFTKEKLVEVTGELAELNPDFISVTYGAGGTNRSGTIEIASHIKNNLNIEVMSHLTCIGSTKQDISNYISEIKKHNIKNVLALRGDIPQGRDESIYDEGDYRYASDLINDIKNEDITIAGAFYPETHFENNDLQDLIHLKNKVDLGVDFLISQIFFDNDKFFNFMEQAQKLNINVPLSAGIMPVTNAAQIKRITSLCKSSIPKKLEKILDKYGHDHESMKKAGFIYATEQIIELLANDIPAIHLYAMNKPEVARAIMNNIEFVR